MATANDKIKVLEDEIASLKDYVAKADKTIAELKAKIAEASAKNAADAKSIELAIIYAGSKIPVETLLGKKYKTEEDENGFTHVFVPESEAKRLLVAGGVTEFLLVGGAESFALFRPRGLYSDPVTIYRHEFKDGKWVSTEPKTEEGK